MRRFREVREPLPEEYTINYTPEDLARFTERSIETEIVAWVRDNHPEVIKDIENAAHQETNS